MENHLGLLRVTHKERQDFWWFRFCVFFFFFFLDSLTSSTIFGRLSVINILELSRAGHCVDHQGCEQDPASALRTVTTPREPDKKQVWWMAWLLPPLYPSWVTIFPTPGWQVWPCDMLRPMECGQTRASWFWAWPACFCPCLYFYHSFLEVISQDVYGSKQDEWHMEQTWDSALSWSQT